MPAPMIEACAACLRRTDLIASVSGRIEIEWRLRRGRPQLLALPDDDLLEWARDAAAARRYEAFSADYALDRLVAAGLGALCRHATTYPPGLAELADPPAVLHVLGDPRTLEPARGAVALVGARRPSAYGLEVAGALGRGLAAAGVTVVSGMAMGVDSAAHAGALAAGGPTIATLATGADRPYPARARTLHARIAATGCVVSELPPGFEPRRWAFPARNRIIAALAAVTVVVEGGERSGSLITADFAAELGRGVGAVPGHVTSRLAAGPHALLAAGADLVRDSADVLALLRAIPDDPGPARVVIGAAPSRPAGPAGALPPPPGLDPRLAKLLARIERGQCSLAELVSDPADGLATARDLGELETLGLIRRVFGGRYLRAPG